MSTFNIWAEGSLDFGVITPVIHVATTEGSDFLDATLKWYHNCKHNERLWGKLEIKDGIPYLWKCRLYETEVEASKTYYQLT